MLAWVMDLGFAASDAGSAPPATTSRPSTLLMLMAGVLVVLLG